MRHVGPGPHRRLPDRRQMIPGSIENRLFFCCLKRPARHQPQKGKPWVTHVKARKPKPGLSPPHRALRQLALPNICTTDSFRNPSEKSLRFSKLCGATSGHSLAPPFLCQKSAPSFPNSLRSYSPFHNPAALFRCFVALVLIGFMPPKPVAIKTRFLQPMA